ncbi:MAG: tetratricopeptide repeat protein [Prevotella sp.]|nr:tetratricopeptide repeat protein [Prevotella sp.]
MTVISCGSSTKTASNSSRGVKPAVTRRVLSYNDEQRFKYFYLGAVDQQMKGNYAGAFDLLNHCQEINPDAAEVYFMRSAYHALLNNDSLTLADIQKAAELNPQNNVYLERLAGAYIGSGKYDEAIEAYEKLYANNHDRDDVLNVLIRLYGQQKDYDNMLQTINRLENLEGSSEEITLARMRVYSLKGDKQAELAELKDLSKKHPNDMNYRVMMGNWLLQNELPADALKEYEYVLAQEPDNLMAQMSMLDYYNAIGQDSLAAELQEKLVVSPATPLNSKMTLMRGIVNSNEQQGGDSTEVLRIFRHILAQPQKTSDMWELQAAYMSLKQMPQDSIDNSLRGALEVAPDNAGVRLQLIQSKWKDQLFDDVISLCKPALEYNPDEMAFYYFLGLAYFQKDEKDKALHTFQLGVSQINSESNKEIVSDFYAIMGDILHEKGREQEAYVAYDSCLQWKDDNLGALNNYAYYLSEKGKDLQKAEKMSYRTIKAEPKNSTFLDTYAWILFMQERYEEANIYIEQAVQNDSTVSNVILEHAGDISAKLGNMKKAVEWWEKARDAGGNSKVLIRKIKLRKYLKK